MVSSDMVPHFWGLSSWWVSCRLFSSVIRSRFVANPIAVPAGRGDDDANETVEYDVVDLLAVRLVGVAVAGSADA